MTKLRLLTRYTDILMFVDLEGTDKCRMTLKTRGRSELPTVLEGTDEDVINRGLAIVEAGLPHFLKEDMRRALDELLFPTFEEFMALHRDDTRTTVLPATEWLDRYQIAKASYNLHGSEPPLNVKVKAFDPGRFDHYKTYLLKPAGEEETLSEDHILLVPNGSADSMQSWVLPKSEWWRFVTIAP